MQELQPASPKRNTADCYLLYSVHSLTSGNKSNVLTFIACVYCFDMLDVAVWIWRCWHTLKPSHRLYDVPHQKYDLMSGLLRWTEITRKYCKVWELWQLSFSSFERLKSSKNHFKLANLLFASAGSVTVSHWTFKICWLLSSGLFCFNRSNKCYNYKPLLSNSLCLKYGIVVRLWTLTQYSLLSILNCACSIPLSVISLSCIEALQGFSRMSEQSITIPECDWWRKRTKSTLSLSWNPEMYLFFIPFQPRTNYLQLNGCT